MSKNFELLRQAGWKQDLFEGGQIEAPPPRTSTSGANKTSHSSTTARPLEHRRLAPPSRGDQISSLVQRVFLDPRNPDIRAVVFSGVAPRAGCSWACAQTARTLAALVDGTVCVVDVNFAAPSMHGQFSIENLVGLSDAVLQSKPPCTFTRQIESSNLYVLAAGGECNRARSADGNIAQSLHELRRDFDYLLIDAPSVASGSLASSVAHAADGAILVLESTGIALESLLRAKERLKSARIALFGVVLNDRRSSAHSLFGQFLK